MSVSQLCIVHSDGSVPRCPIGWPKLLWVVIYQQAPKADGRFGPFTVQLPSGGDPSDIPACRCLFLPNRAEELVVK